MPEKYLKQARITSVDQFNDSILKKDQKDYPQAMSKCREEKRMQIH